MSLPTISIDQDVLTQEAEAFEIFDHFERYRDTSETWGLDPTIGSKFEALYFGKSGNVEDTNNWTLHDKNFNFDVHQWKQSGSTRTGKDVWRTGGKQSKLAKNLNSSSSLINVSEGDGSKFRGDNPSSFITIDQEVMEVTDVNGDELTVNRGKEGTLQTKHDADTTIFSDEYDSNDDLPLVPDIEIVDYSLNSTQKKALRISNYYYSTGFSGQLFTPQFSIPAGREGSNVANSDESKRNRYAYFKLRFKPVINQKQSDLSVRFTPAQKFDSTRISIIGLQENVDEGLYIYAWKYDNDKFAKFAIKNNLAWDEVHTIEMEMDFGTEDGIDKMRIKVDDDDEKTFKTWQGFYDKSQGVDSMIMRVADEGSSDVQGKGIYIISYEQSTGNTSKFGHSSSVDENQVTEENDTGNTESGNASPSNYQNITVDRNFKNESITSPVQIRANHDVSFQDSSFDSTVDFDVNRLNLRNITGSGQIHVYNTSLHALNALGFSISQGKFADFKFGR